MEALPGVLILPEEEKIEEIRVELSRSTALRSTSVRIGSTLTDRSLHDLQYTLFDTRY
jgi:hypothetical protein